MKKAPPKKKPISQIIIWGVVVVAVVAVALMLLLPKGGSGITKVDSAGLIAAQAKGAQIVDVRTSGEYELGHIKGAINVPVDQIAQTAATWNKDNSYVVYCASGARSAEAQQTMAGMGFKNVADLTGGVASWTGPLEKGTSTSQQTIQTSGKPVFIEFYTPT
ncbi:MAG: rhodanese-like domain-containing protein [Coriobacteriia bacterium]|nr:rhodanese-like domain-containing protein [Coriobacteriia bacterium]